MAALLRIVAGAAGLPVGAVAGALHGWMCGPQAVLEVEVRGIEDALERHAFLHRLRRVAHDDNVAAVLLRLREPLAGWASGQDLRNVIAALRRAGRAVYAWAEAPGNHLLWIAAACDKVFVPPITQVNLVGVGVELTFFGSALHRLGMAPDFEAAGAYKSFGEAWTRSFASPENQEAVRHLVEDLQDQLLRDLGDGRGRSREELDAALARAPLSAPEALEAGLVDHLVYEDQLEDWLEEHHGSRAKRISWAAWARRDALLEWIGSWGEGGTVVSVVHLQGPIMMDERGNNNVIAAHRVVPLLRALRKNDRVGAVVLHVDSPGGSVLASDLIWREVDKLRQDKPVVASFEDVAASGGYYLAAPAAEILARPSTLTGSIGVFGGKLVAGEGLRKVGVHTQEISASPNANMLSASRPFTDAQRARFRESLERFYAEFVQRVASGRRRPEDAVEPHCRGRVWTGRAARERGLVDRHGDLFDAVDRARTLAGLHPAAYRRRDVSGHRRNWVSRQINKTIREALPGGASLAAMAGGRILPLLRVLEAHQGEALAMLPFDIELV